jgi:hypothetical protein
MSSLDTIPPALSIRQPWVDLILRGEKTIEIREWPVKRRGPIVIHASRTVDWKTVELLGYEGVLALPRGGLVAWAEILDVEELTHDRWQDLMPHHRVIHPPAREPIYGIMLGSVKPFRQKIPCPGRSMFFPVPAVIEARVRQELVDLGIMVPID